jgi:hypothetical protein
MAGLLGPRVGIDALFLQHLERLLEVAQAGKLEARLQHVLARQAQLQAPRPQRLVDGADVEHDDVAVVARRQPGGEAHRQELLLAAVDAGEDAKAVAPLRPQVRQRLLDRPLLAIAQRGASEQAHARLLLITLAGSRRQRPQGWLALRLAQP